MLYSTGPCGLLRRACTSALLASVFFICSPAHAGCSFSHGLACFWQESTCWPALVGSRDAFLNCVSQLSHGYCTPCVGSGDPHDSTDPSGSDNSNSTEPFSYVRATLASKVVGPNLDGRYEVSAVGADGVLFHIWQANGGWSQPAAYPSSPLAASIPTVVQRGLGPLDVFAITPTGDVGHVQQLAPNVNWGPWEILSHDMAGSIAATMQTFGMTVLAATGRDGQVYYAKDPDLATWKSLAGASAGSPSIAVNKDGRLEIFTQGKDGALRHIWELSPGGQWSSWDTLGQGIYGDPVTASNADGRIAVFVSTQGQGLRIYQQVAPNTGWGSPTDLPGTHVGSPTVVTNKDGRLEVFVTGVVDHAVYHAIQSSPGKAFKEWKSLGGTLTSSPVATKSLDGKVAVFGLGADHSVWANMEKKPEGSSWTGWQRLGGQANQTYF